MSNRGRGRGRGFRGPGNEYQHPPVDQQVHFRQPRPPQPAQQGDRSQPSMAQQVDPPRLSGPRHQSTPQQFNPRQQSVPRQFAPRQQSAPRQWGPRQQLVPQQEDPRQQSAPQREEPRQQWISQQPITSPQSIQRESSMESKEPTPSDTSTGQEQSKRSKKRGKKGGKTDSEQAGGSSVVSNVQQPGTSSKMESEQKPVSKEKLPAKEVTKAADNCNLAIPKRKNVGNQGEKIIIETNYLPLVFKKKDLNIFHYDVEVKHKDPGKSKSGHVPKRLLRDAVSKMQEKHFSNRYPAFDGTKNLYAAATNIIRNKQEISDTVEVKDKETCREKCLIVTIKLVATICIDRMFKYMEHGKSFDVPQSCVQAIDIALRSQPTMITVNVGRSFYSEPIRNNDPARDLGDGLELWDGMFQSCIMGWKTAYLNVDVAHKGFPKKMNVIDYFREYCKYNGNRNIGLDENGYNKASKFLQNIKVEYKVNPTSGYKIVFKVASLGNPPHDSRFTKDDREITVEEYFRREKNYKIMYPNLPCIITSSKAQIPPELCDIIGGQAVNRKLNELQTSKMVKYAARPSNERRARIVNFIDTVQFNTDPVLREFGIEVDNKFAKINARILAPPTLSYYRNVEIRPRDGAWRQDKFFDGKQLNDWVILNFDKYTDQRAIKYFVDMLIGAGREMGIDVQETQSCQYLPNTSIHAIRQKFNEISEQYLEMQLLVIILPDYPQGVYGFVKRIAELEIGVVTQCVKQRTISRMSRSTAQNILLKINTKLNGMNHKLGTNSSRLALAVPTMIVGADVTHPSPDQKEIPSIAAVVASCDAFAYRYMSQYRLQPARMEIIQDMEEIILEMLREFEMRTRYKPRKLIFYRDGVSEGQFKEVMVSEVAAVQKACKRFGGAGYEPRVTFVVVQKRHHTRFFPTCPRSSQGKNFNVPPGTIVDTNITHPTEFDFYLVSHASIQGTARPTKYHLIYDDNDFDANTLQLLTYYLCHLFSRCNRTVSYPAPTYYAHLIAFRCRAYMEHRRLSEADMDNLNTERHCGTVARHILKDSPMFFV